MPRKAPPAPPPPPVARPSIDCPHLLLCTGGACRYLDGWRTLKAGGALPFLDANGQPRQPAEVPAHAETHARPSPSNPDTRQMDLSVLWDGPKQVAATQKG